MLSDTCLNVDALIESFDCRLLVDTGFPVSILSEPFSFSKVPNRNELLTEAKTTVHTADGTELRIKGKIKTKMKLGKFFLEQELIVAKIDDLAGIFGMDFREVQNAEIHVGKLLMKLNEQTIKLSKGRNETCAKFRLSEKVSISAASEMFVEGYVDVKLKVDFGLVESKRYMQSKGLLLAKALVNVKDEEKCSFYLSNVTQKGMKLGPDSVIGVLSRVDVMDDVQGIVQPLSPVFFPSICRL
jgi:hypothetical protein